MKKFKSILYVSHGLASQSDSIGQALRLSANYQADVQGLLFCPSLPSNLSEYQISYENSLTQTVKQQIKESREMHQISEEVAPFPLDVVCGDQPAVDIIHTVQNASHDLVIKDAEPVEGRGFKAIDMTLLRKCPSAVWLNRLSHQATSKRRIAVAVDPMITSDEEKSPLPKVARAIKLNRYQLWQSATPTFMLGISTRAIPAQPFLDQDRRW